jgi:glycine cleavage system H protein
MVTLRGGMTMIELMTLTQTPAGLAILIFGGIVTIMIFARLAFFGMFFLAIPVVAAAGGLRAGARRLAVHQKTDFAMEVLALEVHPSILTEVKDYAGAEAETPAMVEGFKMPRNLRYHPNHIWMKRDTDGKVRIGFDDFAQRLMGAIRQIDMLTFNVHQLGKIGSQSFLKGWDVYSDAKSVRLASPLRGRIVDVNSGLGQEPSKISEDPYGEGWLCTIMPETDADPMEGTIYGGQVDRWIKDEVNRLRHYISDQGIAVLQDGGEIVQNPAEILSESEWQLLVKAFISA